MYAQIDHFPIDKALNTVVEEGIAPIYIRRFHELRGRKVWKVEKNLADLKGSRLYDLIDGMGVRWEVKNDKAAFSTGNVYVEERAFLDSEADYYLFLVGKGYVVAKTALSEEMRLDPSRTAGGDNLRSLGLKIKLERLDEISEAIIIL